MILGKTCCAGFGPAFWEVLSLKQLVEWHRLLGKITLPDLDILNVAVNMPGLARDGGAVDASIVKLGSSDKNLGMSRRNRMGASSAVRCNVVLCRNDGQQGIHEYCRYTMQRMGKIKRTVKTDSVSSPER